MKIAVMIDTWWPAKGGGPIHVLEISKKLIDIYDCNIDIFTRSIKDKNGKCHNKKEKLLDGKLNIYRIGPCTDSWNLFGRLTYLFTSFYKVSNKYDLIHAHSFIAGIPAHLLQKFKNMPVVFTVHGAGSDYKDTGISGILKRYIKKKVLFDYKYDYVISVNKEFQRIGEKYHDKIKYIPNGVDLEKFKSVKSVSKEGLLFIGRLHFQKSVNSLIKAMDYVVKEKPEVKLKIIGSGPLEEELKKLTNDLNLTDRINFLGKVSYEDIKKHYQTSELFILPSLFEGQPLTLLEAWAMEVPVIATNVVGTKEILKHKINGYLVSPNNPKELAEGILFALDNKNETEKWIKEGKRLVKEEYSWDKVAKETYKIYELVVSENKGGCN